MEFCIREALVAVLEINDVKQVGFIALEIINHNSYMNEMLLYCIVLYCISILTVLPLRG